MSEPILRTDQLPHLLKLLDDSSPRVRAKVAGALREFGPALRAALAATPESEKLNPAQKAVLERILADMEKEDGEDFSALWQRLRLSRDEIFKTESALEFLARWQFQIENDERSLGRHSLRIMLGRLSGEYYRSEKEVNAASLARWLFRGRLRGAPTDEYYAPLNSNIVHVLQSGSGLPISLVVIFMLIGRRVGLDIKGCPFPGHFLARCGSQFFDCYNGGRILNAVESDAVYTALAAKPNDSQSAPLDAPAALIIARVLANIANAYQFADEPDKVQQAYELLEQLRTQETS